MLLPLANSALCKRSSGNGAAKQHKNSTLYESAVSGGLALWSGSGRNPAGFWTLDQNQGQLECQCHVVPKTVFRYGGDWTQKFTLKMTILA